MNRDYFSEPTLFYPRPEPLTFNDTTPFQSSFAPRQAPPSSRPTLITRTSRKRSRDDFDDHFSSAMAVQPIAAMQVEEEPIYGEGMTIIDRKTGRAVGADSQTGTWFEEQLEAERLATAQAAAQLAISQQAALQAEQASRRPKKAIRLDSMSGLPTSTGMVTPPQTPVTASHEPVVDAATLMLGVGWRIIPTDKDMQAAKRGWARYIDNHYSELCDADIVLKSDGQEAFLVQATNDAQRGIYLFKDDLSEGRFVAITWEECAVVMRTPDIILGRSVLSAVSSPKLTFEPAGMDID